MFKLTFVGKLYLIFSVTQIRSTGTGIVRFCKNNGDQAQFTATECTGGILQQGSQWDCACVSGSWILSNGCGQNDRAKPHFIYGDNPAALRCLNKKNFNSHGGAVSFRSLTTGPLLLTGTHGTIVQPTVTKYGYHFVVNPVAKCHSGGVPGTFSILLTNPKSPWTARLNEDPYAFCLLPKPFTNGAVTQGIYMYAVSNLCDTRDFLSEETIFLTLVEGCEYENGAEWLDLPPIRVNNSTDSTVPEDCGACAQTDRNPRVSTEHHCSKGDDCTSAVDTTTPHDINLQSSRAGMYLLGKILESAPNPDDFDRLVANELKILTKAALIAVKACNPTVIPVALYQYLLLIFKLLLFESKMKYPLERSLTLETAEGIDLVLKKCLARTTSLGKIDFQGKCVPKVHGSLTFDLPLSIKWQSNFDLVLEFVWKLSSFLIYHCFQDFSKRMTYHKELKSLLESLFNQDLLQRWLNPSNSNAMYRHLLEPHLDLNTTLTNFDRCVGAAHASSTYAKDAWLQRPTTVVPSMSRTKRSEKSSTQVVNSTLTSGLHCFSTLASFLETTGVTFEMCW